MLYLKAGQAKTGGQEDLGGAKAKSSQRFDHVKAKPEVPGKLFSPAFWPKAKKQQQQQHLAAKKLPPGNPEGSQTESTHSEDKPLEQIAKETNAPAGKKKWFG